MSTPLLEEIPWWTPTPGRWTGFADRVDGTPLGPVPIMGTSFSQILSDFGTGTATVSCVDSPLDRDDLLRMYGWRLHLHYQGQRVWVGLPTGIKDDLKVAVTLNFVEVHGYLQKRALTGEAGTIPVFDPVAGLVMTQVEQCEMARQIASPVSEVGVQIVTDPNPPFSRDRTYTYLEGPMRSDLLKNLSQVGSTAATVTNGPEFAMTYTNAQATLNIAVRIGRAGDLALVAPGNAIAPTLTWDASQLRTRTYAVGDQPDQLPDGTQPPKPVVIRDNPTPDPLLPRLDGIDDWGGVTLVSTLTERAETNAALYNTPTLTVAGQVFENDPDITSYGLGDDVQVMITSPFDVGGRWAKGRLHQRDVDCATGLVTWTVALTDPLPARERPTLTGQVADLSRMQQSMFRRRLAPWTQ